MLLLITPTYGATACLPEKVEEKGLGGRGGNEVITVRTQLCGVAEGDGTSVGGGA